tara:strand:+ start:75 stop:305 length:231 start_codon:yes stop_codon:yes gene_type:complete
MPREAPIPMNRKTAFTEMYVLIILFRADDNVVVPPTPKCATENNLPLYLLGVCSWIIEVLLTIINGIPIPWTYIIP